MAPLTCLGATGAVRPPALKLGGAAQSLALALRRRCLLLLPGSPVADLCAKIFIILHAIVMRCTKQSMRALLMFLASTDVFSVQTKAELLLSLVTNRRAVAI